MMMLRTLSRTVAVCAIAILGFAQWLHAETPREMLEQIRMGDDLSYVEQKAILERLQSEAPDTSETLAAMGWVAAAASQEERIEEALALWHELAEHAPWMPPQGAGQPGIWAMVSVNGAARHIAESHEERGEWEQALAWWRKYEPREPCGTGAAASRASRNWHIANCLLELGHTDEAMQVLDEEVFDSPMACEIDAVVTWLRLNQQRGNLDATRQRLAESSAEYTSMGVEMAREVVAMLDDHAAGEASELWQRLLQTSPQRLGGSTHDWEPCVAFELLTHMPKRSLALAREKLSSDDQEEREWAIALITTLEPEDGLSLTRSALDAVAEEDRGEWPWEAAFFALQSKGDDIPAGARLLEEVAEGGEPYGAYEYNRARQRAADILKRFPTPEAARSAFESKAALPLLTDSDSESASAMVATELDEQTRDRPPAAHLYGLPLALGVAMLIMIALVVAVSKRRHN